MKKIYIHKDPDGSDYLKIGDTNEDNITDRLIDSVGGAGRLSEIDLEALILYSVDAMRNDANHTQFRDLDIHKLLKKHNVVRHRKGYGKRGWSEYFTIQLEVAIHVIESYINGTENDIDIFRINDYLMRDEQELGVSITRDYFIKFTDTNCSFLWNGKMRLGKSFMSYQLMLQMEFTKVLILTHVPSIKDSWESELNTHIDFKGYEFLSGRQLSNINQTLANNSKVVAFASYQDVKGDNLKTKHKELFNTDWDLVIIDEFHIGAMTKEALKIHNDEDSLIIDTEIINDETDDGIELLKLVNKKIKTKRKLYLSGTPFKALATEQFSEEAIYNWTYMDEQKAKADFVPTEARKVNPYLSLASLTIKAIHVSDELKTLCSNYDKNAFRFSELFKVMSVETDEDEDDIPDSFMVDGKADNSDVVKFLDIISGVNNSTLSIEDEFNGLKVEDAEYPFSAKSMTQHSIWFVTSIKAAAVLERLLNNHMVFETYKTVNVAAISGNGVAKVKSAIALNNKTITISVRKLNTGVTIPEWTICAMMNDTISPELYFQSIFRIQSPWIKNINGVKTIMKHTCEVLDFLPHRSLTLLQKYSDGLQSVVNVTDLNQTTQSNMAELLKYTNIVKIKGNKMATLDVNTILTELYSALDGSGVGYRFNSVNNISTSTLNLSQLSEIDKDRFDDIIKKLDSKNYLAMSNTKKQKHKPPVSCNTVIDANRQDNETEKGEKEIVPLTAEEIESKRVKKMIETIKKVLTTMIAQLARVLLITPEAEYTLQDLLESEKADETIDTFTGLSLEEFKFLITIGQLNVKEIDLNVLLVNKTENSDYTNDNTI